ncbi:MAG: deoxyribose-phosphate aldolase [Candidatus Njordarchaeia archaeon]
MLPNTVEELAKYIDHTLLKPNIGQSDIEKIVNDAKKYGFRAICIPPIWVSKAKELLEGNSSTKIATVVGFPLGYSSIEVKVYETKTYLEMGADELDVVMNISAFKSGLYDYVEREIKEIVKSADGHIVKVIIGTDYLTDDEIVLAAKIAVKAGAHVVKTNTGFGLRGASLNDIRLIREAINGQAMVKAAGGIRTAVDALKFIKSGADIIGTSSGVKILEEFTPDLLNSLGG